MIHTQHDFLEIEYSVPSFPDLERVFASKSFEPFCDEVMSLLQELSVCLLQNKEARSYPDVISFAFWCRAGSLRAMKERYTGRNLRIGRGVVFHVAPSNVPVNFAYSLVVGLLSGNINIVRMPSRNFPQIEIICSVFHSLFEQENFKSLKHHVVLLRYDRNDSITDFFSAHCDVRVIWGGDKTIQDIRRSLLSPRSFDLTFADRYSFCVIKADAYIDDSDTLRIAEDFYNDTYLFDQNACTAPHLVVWLGAATNVERAQDIFWSSLHQVVADKYQLQSVSAVDKLAAAYVFASSIEGCRVRKMQDNLIVRIQLDKLIVGLDDMRSTCGYFYEYAAETIEDILPIINRKFQTLAYYGIDAEQLQKFIQVNLPVGIDRIVPIGRTLDFSLEWDGYDLITMLSRTVCIHKK